MKKQRRIPARQQLRRPSAPTEASLVIGPSTQAFAPGKKVTKKQAKADVKMAKKGIAFGVLGKAEPESENNMGVAAPGMYDARPARKPSDREYQASLGGEPLRNPLESVPRVKSDPNMLPAV